MNKLPRDKRVQIITLLVEGTSMRATARIADVAFNTVAKLFIETAKVCLAYQDKTFRNLKSKRLQLDEIWSFVYAKQKNVPDEKRGEAGDIWTWVAIDADTKLVPSWRIGSRNTETAVEFVCDLADRFASRVQITSDGHKPYLEAVDAAFGKDVDFAQLHKIYGHPTGAEKRYSPPECVGCERRAISGKPDKKHVSTSFVERQNLTMRMSIRRFTRLTNAFSKKLENHALSVALHYMHYNFARIHKTLRITPAMAAGISERVWDIGDIVNLLESKESENIKYA